MHEWLYFITYDLREPRRDYTNLFSGIMSVADDWLHPLESVWIVRSRYSEGAIRDVLREHVDANDALLVFEVKPNMWASWGLAPNHAHWLNQQVA
jgi:hypothetical protein